jgi:predicted RNase H-like HicB family nuclease
VEIPKTLNQRAAQKLLERSGWVRAVGGKHSVKMEKQGRRPITPPRQPRAAVQRRADAGDPSLGRIGLMARVSFHAVVHREADGSFWAEVKELPGCFASGFGMEELQEALLEAIQLSLPDGIELGEPEWHPVRASGSQRELLVSA